jgi:integrase/recombinase XerD
MRLLHAGVGTTVIAVWLGHETVDTTQINLATHLTLLEDQWPRAAAPSRQRARHRHPATRPRFVHRERLPHQLTDARLRE